MYAVDNLAQLPKPHYLVYRGAGGRSDGKKKLISWRGMSGIFVKLGANLARDGKWTA